MSESFNFDRVAPPVRHVEVNRGDTLRRIALRELGDAARWVDLVTVNNLRPPYIVEDEGDRVAGVVVYGDLIKVPSPAPTINYTTDPEKVFFTDLLVDRGALRINDGGDLMLVSGVSNFTQMLRHRVIVEKGDLAFHPEYGCLVRQVIGNISSNASAQMAAFYVRSCLVEDDRVESVASCVAEVFGDQIRVKASVVPISGRPIDIDMVV